jgi:hypothetical protein
MIPRQEELHRIEVLKQFFEAPIVEELGRTAPAARMQRNRAVI